MKKINFISPCYNEQDNIPIIYAAINQIMDKLPKFEYKFIFADNTSTDKSEAVLKDLAKKDKKVCVILNNKNFGPDKNAMNAFLSSSGDAVVLIACDMQNPPQLITDFLKHWENGAKVILAQKTASNENSFMKLSRSLYYRIIKNLSDTKQYKHVTGWGLYDREVVEKLRVFKEPVPLLRHLVPSLGYEPVLVPYTHPSRQNGKSSYNFFKYFDMMLSSLVNTTDIPLKLCIFFGLFMSILSGLAGLFYFVYKLLYWNSFNVGIAPLVIGMFFMSSVQIFFLGVCGEYILSILNRVSFTSYVTEKERINFED